ncbi:sodium-dependent transporter [Alkalicoccobacillus murimartini]|uniref:Transporter n=1 Tax=Alkalicoccobacillus murimartini TaxID=171685 RepID=A0ABT9YKJ6_9BACI|nr:sodium-dependent transporter [Alkalicoccobacillus murimartini]MDQ0208385.1 NSS family neurotransmitter:Na+ symporter [Alkalicoccobacillus murimartini]
MNEQWSSKLGFILASAGAAIGLGALWRFPYLTGMNGGGAFFLLFIFFTLLIGMPLLISEFIIGRGSKREAVSAYAKLQATGVWKWIGRFGLVGCFLLLTFYAVIGGWILTYSILSLTGSILRPGGNYEELFGYIVGSPLISIAGLVVFIAINVAVLSFGIKNGIERVNKYLMPLLFVFLFIIIIRSLTLDGAMEGVRFFLDPDFNKITTAGTLEALGQSFFSLAVGFSCMVTYSSYLGNNQSLPKSAGSIVILNLLVSLMAGLAVFPAVFAFNLEPDSGPALLFVVLPSVFEQIPLGGMFLSLFLLLFFFATLTSSFSLLEIMISAFTQNKRYKRNRVAMISGLLVTVAGIPAALSNNLLSDVSLFGRSVFDLTDFVVSNLMLPIGCLFIALFVGYKMNKSILFEQYQLASGGLSRTAGLWYLLMQTIVPTVIVIVFIFGLIPL